MRKTLLALTAVVGLCAAGVATSAAAAPVGVEVTPAAPMVQPVQYYYGHPGWHRRVYWRHREWERRRHWYWRHHAHPYYRRW